MTGNFQHAVKAALVAARRAQQKGEKDEKGEKDQNTENKAALQTTESRSYPGLKVETHFCHSFSDTTALA